MVVRSLGRDRFVAICGSSGLTTKDAEELADALAKMPEPTDEKKT